MEETPPAPVPSQLPLPGFPSPESIHDEVPPGMITLPDAARKYGINRGTLRGWVNKRRVWVTGRLRGPAQGGGYLLLDEEELVAFLSALRDKGGGPNRTA